MNNQDEMFEMATETPAFLGCQQRMPTHLPGDFDGVEAGEGYEEYRRDTFCVICDWIIATLILIAAIICIYMTGEYFKAKAIADQAVADYNAYCSEHPIAEVH